MVKNLWGMMKVFCQNKHDDKSIEMIPGYVKGIMAYKCPHCSNYVTMNEFEKTVDKIGDMLYEAELNSEILNLENIKWTNKGVVFRIAKHTNNNIEIEVYNKGAIANG